MRRLALLLLLLPLAGCRSYLLPFDERPLPVREPIPTAGGARLDIGWGGRLVSRPGPGDIGGTIGAELADVDSGVLVAHRIDPGCRLAPGDRIVHVVAALPDAAERVARAHVDAWRSAWLEQTDVFLGLLRRFDHDEPPGTVLAREELQADDVVFDPATQGYVPGPAAPADPGEVRRRRGAHPVRSVDDLRPYLAGVGWTALDLVVVRDGAEVVVRLDLWSPETPVRTTPYLPVRARWHGVDLVSLHDLPASLQPLHARRGDLLVVRVARDAPAGRAGLRPLDLLASHVDTLLPPTGPNALPGAERGVPDEPGGGRQPARVRRADGRVEVLRFEPREEPTSLWIPLLFALDLDGSRGHLGLGPFELLGHASWRRDYSPTSDAHETTWRWSVAATIQGAGLASPGGSRDTGGVTLGLDLPRWSYLLEWWDLDDEAARRREEPPYQ